MFKVERIAVLPSHAPTGMLISQMARLARPRQWLKNGVVGAALVFAGRLTDGRSVALTLAAIAVFCAVSSAGYIVNDLIDAPSDRRHPLKKLRPIAAGFVTPAPALALAAVLLATGLAASALIRPGFLLVTAAYAAVTLSYSLALKRIPAFDVLAVAAGFLIRAIAGAVAIDVPASGWLLLLTALIALYIILIKRLTDPAPAVLRGLAGPYPDSWLKHGIRLVGAACLVAYALYTVLSHSLPVDHSMLITVPFVAFGLLRYANLSGAIGARPGPWVTAVPDETLVRDQYLLLAVMAWAVASIAAMYWIR